MKYRAEYNGRGVHIMSRKYDTAVEAWAAIVRNLDRRGITGGDVWQAPGRVCGDTWDNDGRFASGTRGCGYAYLTAISKSDGRKWNTLKSR